MVSLPYLGRSRSRQEIAVIDCRVGTGSWRWAGDGRCTGIASKYPDTRLKIEAAVDLGVGDATRQNPFVQSAWMFATDLFAAAIPVILFAFLSLAPARIVSLLMTLVLLILLGIGRARIGHRRVLPTVAETIGIAAAAAAAGVGVGKLIS